ncbi:hypothetical protein BN2475_950016 [Paraburkholderia ribeironis]|uniref:Uncharacterized protein n=1 Tax=Paraburkholderia ribeironis TaxID=1247936 RepID=A0A1N7SL78_9BURK|nr:hypothetical protein [Paraburkholderia ribeironis]SIT48181.1 hypothetical protein BN2475_950016 [Paraburkholderia ribeironis]
MSSPAVQTEAIFLLDRNVVSLIKDAVAGKTQTDAKKQAYLEWLRTLDVPVHSISPLLSTMEGEKGYEDSIREKAASLEKETYAVGQFFKCASTDAAHLLGFRDSVAGLFTGMKESLWDERADFLIKAAPLVAQKVAVSKRRGLENELVQLARATGLAANDAIVILFLACLYGSDAARRVIKPAKPSVHNVLTDLHAIPRVGMVKAIAKQLPSPLRVRLLTRDEGLFDVLKHMRIVRPRFATANRLEMQIEYRPALFPALAAADAFALLQRLEDAATSNTSSGAI